MVFLPRTDYADQEKCREIIETVLLEENFSIYGWRQVPINSSVLGETAEQSRPEIAQVIFKKNENLETNDLERNLFEARKKLKNLPEKINLRISTFALLVQDLSFIKECFLRKCLQNFTLIYMIQNLHQGLQYFIKDILLIHS